MEESIEQTEEADPIAKQDKVLDIGIEKEDTTEVVADSARTVQETTSPTAQDDKPIEKPGAPLKLLIKKDRKRSSSEKDEKESKIEQGSPVPKAEPQASEDGLIEQLLPTPGKDLPLEGAASPVPGVQDTSAEKEFEQSTEKEEELPEVEMKNENKLDPPTRVLSTGEADECEKKESFSQNLMAGSDVWAETTGWQDESELTISEIEGLGAKADETAAECAVVEEVPHEVISLDSTPAQSQQTDQITEPSGEAVDTASPDKTSVEGGSLPEDPSDSMASEDATHDKDVNEESDQSAAELTPRVEQHLPINIESDIPTRGSEVSLNSEGTDVSENKLDTSTETTVPEEGAEEEDEGEVKAKDESIDTSTSSSSSYVKCMIEEAMVESMSKDHDAHSVGSSEKSDLVKIGSEQTSGHTSGDEIDTTTSSDIEIISNPTPNGDGRGNDRPFDLSPLRHVLSRSMAQEGSSHKRSDSSGSSGHSRGEDHDPLSPDSYQHSIGDEDHPGQSHERSRESRRSDLSRSRAHQAREYHFRCYVGSSSLYTKGENHEFAPGL